MSITVGQIIRNKPDVWSVAPDEMVFTALEIMAEKDIGALVVIKDEKLVGIFSERDYARKVILRGRSSKTTTVGELMTKDVFTVTKETSIKDCLTLATEKRFRHLPVVEKGKVVGMVTIGDIVKAIISDQQSTIDQMEDYITGRGYGH